MDDRSDIFSGSPDGFHLRDVSVHLARPDERRRWDALMNEHHYLGFKRFAGRGLRYDFEWRGQWVDLTGWQSGAFKCRPRDKWIAQVRQFERNFQVTSTVKSRFFNGLYDIEVLVHEIFVITYMDHKAIDTR